MFIIFFLFLFPTFYFYFFYFWRPPAEKSCRNIRLADENSRFSSLFAAGDVSCGGTSSAAKNEEKRLFRRLIKGKSLLFILKKKGKI